MVRKAVLGTVVAVLRVRLLFFLSCFIPSVRYRQRFTYCFGDLTLSDGQGRREG